MSTKGRLLSWLGGWALKQLEVAAVETLGDFRRVALAGELPPFAPGDKVQALVGEDEVRTWTPIPRPGGAELLVYAREADAPGMRWIRSVAVGDTLRLLGPQPSLKVPDGPVVLVGDETAVAVGAALAQRGDSAVFLELGAPEGAAEALDRYGLSGAAVLRRPARSGAIAEAVQAAGAGRAVLLAGGSDLVRRARDELRAAGRAPAGLRTYWTPGRAGLD